MEIAKTLGKVDEHGNVAEDLRTQILGQLSDRLSYDQLYRDALSDPELSRTRQELEAAVSNANEARKVVFELFQDLDRFSLDDYQPFADIDHSKRRIVEFVRAALAADGGRLDVLDSRRMRLDINGHPPLICTLDRDLAQADETVELLGIDHPLMSGLLSRRRSAPADRAGAAANVGLARRAVLTVWLVQTYGRGNDAGAHLVAVAVDADGKRSPYLGETVSVLFCSPVRFGAIQPWRAGKTARRGHRADPAGELGHRGIAAMDKGYATELVGWVEVI